MPMNHPDLSRATRRMIRAWLFMALAGLLATANADNPASPSPAPRTSDSGFENGGTHARRMADPGSTMSTADPCTRAVAACERWITYGGGPARSMVYSTYPLDVPNAKITRALIMVHGALRNADHYFRTAVAAAFLDGALDDTIVIAPHLIQEGDSPRKDETVWAKGKVNWRDGGVSTNFPALTSFDFVDRIVRRLADKATFPNLGNIVIAGHSAGGQFAIRYEMANKLDGTLDGVTMSYVVANPSTYAWPTADRPLPVGSANPKDAYKEAMDGEKVNTDFEYGPFDDSAAKGYDQWPMGLENLAGYVKDMTAAQLREQLASRKTTYLLGQVDVLPLGGFDDRPAAMAQGPTRRARGEAFANFVKTRLGAKHRVIIVSECAHNDRCMYTSAAVLPVIFPE